MAKKYLDDLTIIYLTANQHPEHFTNYQIDILKKAAEGFPIISVSRKPMDLGTNILDTGLKSHLNMYKQFVEAIKTVNTTYIAAAEDDALYSREHFTEFRPPLDAVSYNRNRWSLFTWTNMFNIKDRISNCTLIAPKDYYLDAWEERFKKFPGDSMPPHRVSEIGRNNQEGWMGVSQRNSINWFSSVPVIHINHPAGTDSVGFKKRMGVIRANEIPYWGRAEDIVKEYR